MALRDYRDSLEQMVEEIDRARKRLGVVVGGSLSKGLVVKLDSGVSLEDLAVGRYVVVHGEANRFFCMITDISLDNTNPEIQSAPPDIEDPFLRAILIGTMAYGKINIQPMLMIAAGENKPLPVKTIPGHFMNVKNATVEDVNAVFGGPDDNHFAIGSPLELPDTPLHVDLKRMVERSVGVFGKSGTGKSFYTRMLLAGVIAKEKAVSLIFDMHNDYGHNAKSEGKPNVQGLKQLFPDRVSVCTLDGEMTRKRGVNPDFDVQIGYDAIEPEDIAMLRETMNLSDAMIDAAYALQKMWKQDWVRRLLKITGPEMDDIEANTPNRIGTIQALKRRIERFERWGFLVEHAAEDSVAYIMHLLADQNKTVVLEFGRYGNSLEAYILVANYLTRRIHERYVDAMERAFATGEKHDEPRNLVIVIEEAHKFLDPRIAQQTIFGIIARELRKYNVTLLVVDQRPSGIDEEVMSQIGTRVTALLDNERDINAVLTGISGAANLREVLSRLDTKQQAIVMGHAVPMPVVIKTRDYDETFYAAIKGEIIGQPVTARPNLGATNGRGGRR